MVIGHKKYCPPSLFYKADDGQSTRIGLRRVFAAIESRCRPT